MKKNKRLDFLNNYRIPTNNHYTAKSGTSKEYYKRANKNPELLKKVSSRLRKRGISVFLSTLLVTSGIPAVSQNYYDNKIDFIPIEKSRDNFERLEEKGVLQEDYQELLELKNNLSVDKIQPDLLENYRKQLEELAIKIGKNKISFYLNNVEADRINFSYCPKTKMLPEWQAVIIRDERSANYSSDTIGRLDYVCSNVSTSKHTIDDKIASYIKDIESLKSEEKMTVDDLKQILSNIEKFINYEVVFSNGDLSINSDVLQEATNLSHDEDR